MPVTTSLEPIPSRDFGYPQARHLLSRAGFGGTPQQVAALAAMGLQGALDALVDFQNIDDTDLPRPEYDPDIIMPLTPEERATVARARRENDQETLERFRAERLRRQVQDRQQMGRIERWWLARMIATPRPLEEKLTLLWHGHFATGHRVIEDSYLMLRQNALFRRHAAGSFADLALGVVRDPAMIRYLNNDQNRRQQPNENLAREMMELFTLGEGQYTEQDIKEGARALTGYFVDDNEFTFNRRQHDEGAKKILGKTGAFNGDEFVKILLSQSACPRWVAYKLYRHFVADLSQGPTPEAGAVIQKMAQQLAQQNYRLAPVLKTLFASRHFYDPAIMGDKVKSPVELVVGTVRTIGAPVRDLGLLTDALSMMGQKLFDPPSVAGWDAGRAWINTSTLFVRQNTCAYLITGKLPFDDGWTRDRIGYDPRKLIENLPSRSVDAIADHLLATLLGGKILAQRRQELAQFLAGRGDPTSEDALLAALMLITAVPEYQLC